MYRNDEQEMTTTCNDQHESLAARYIIFHYLK